MFLTIFFPDIRSTLILTSIFFSCSYETQFGVYEWCMTDAYDASNPQHRKIAHGIEVGDGIPEMRNIENARNALKSVGFEVLHDEDLADRPDEIVS